MVASVAIIMISSCKKETTSTNQLPVCNITSPMEGNEITRGELVTISVEAYDNDGSVAEVRFYIDGVGKSLASGFPYIYEWNTTDEQLGAHILKATSIDNTGGANSDEISVILTDGGGGGGSSPVSNFTANPTSGSAPLTVSFTDNSTNDPKSWLWDFGDGNTSDLQNATHIYNTNGFYTVSLTVSNDYGTDTQEKTSFINVSNGGGGENPCPGTPTVTDTDGNIYNTVLIGNQCWMEENLRVGTRIVGAENMADNGTVEKYCQNDDPVNCEVFGGLYQWSEMMQYSTQQGIRGICPSGWHLPTDEEWKQLEIQLGMSQNEADNTGLRGTDEGKKLKSTSGWFENGNGTNSSGYNALPAGYRDAWGGLHGLSEGCFWWTSTEVSTLQSWYHGLGYYSDGVLRREDYKTTGLSVRCIKD